MSTIIYRTRTLGVESPSTTKGSPLSNAEIDSNFFNLNEELALKLPTSEFTAENVLDLVKTVDGSGSGLDADTLDGHNADANNTVSTIVARDSSGNFSASQITANTFVGSLYLGTSSNITFEGSVDNDYEVTLTSINPTADRTLSLPNATGTLVSTGDTGTVTNTMLAGSIANNKLQYSTISIEGNEVALGESVSITSSDLVWSGSQTFLDNKFTIKDNLDNTKALTLQVSNISSGTTKTLTAPNENGTISTREYMTEYVNALFRGQVAYFPLDDAPTGWLKADGSAVSRTTYSALYAVIGTAFGSGDGSTTFNLPDLRAEFIRGLDSGRGVDSGRVLGSVQTSSVGSHTHDFYDVYAVAGDTKGNYNINGGVPTYPGGWGGSAGAANSGLKDVNGNFVEPYYYMNDGTDGDHDGGGYAFRNRTLAAGSADTRPRNIALLACIKY